jgi:hypothetical protein
MGVGGVRKKILSWCSGLRKSQRKTLGELVVGAMRCRRASLADIGRSMQTATVAKHNIKRVWRFVRNARVQVVEGVRALVCLSAKAAGGQLFIAVDWVDIGRYKVLRAAVPLRGRSVPILFGAYEKWQLHKSQNALEDALFILLKALVPQRCGVVILADCGFQRASLAQHLQGLGLGYVIRITGRALFVSARHHGLVWDVKLKRGQRRDLGFGAYRKTRPVRQRILVYWGRKEPEAWLLATNLAWGWKKIVTAFAQRMMIEELFRDEKNIRYGWGLRQLKVSSAQRLERVLLVLAFAYLLLLLVGLVCRERLSAKHWASAVSKKKHQCSVFVIGRLMHDKVTFPLGHLLSMLDATLREIAELNWG